MRFKNFISRIKKNEDNEVIGCILAFVLFAGLTILMFFGKDGPVDY